MLKPETRGRKGETWGVKKEGRNPLPSIWLSGGLGRLAIGVLCQQIHPAVAGDQQVKVLELASVAELELRWPSRQAPHLFRGDIAASALDGQSPLGVIGWDDLQAEPGDEVRGSLRIVLRHEVTGPAGYGGLGPDGLEGDALRGQMRGQVSRQSVTPPATGQGNAGGQNGQDSDVPQPHTLQPTIIRGA